MDLENPDKLITENTNTSLEREHSQLPSAARNRFRKLVRTAALFGLGAFALNTEARTNAAEVATPQLTQLKEGLNSEFGIRNIKVTVTPFGFHVHTEVGDFQITSEEKVDAKNVNRLADEAFDGVTPTHFTDELIRQNSMKKSIEDTIGKYKLNIAPYAQEVMDQWEITYTKGVLSNESGKVNLLQDAERGGECVVTGSQYEFQPSVMVTCSQVETKKGKPYTIKKISYIIDFSENLVLREVVELNK